MWWFSDLACLTAWVRKNRFGADSHMIEERWWKSLWNWYAWFNDACNLPLWQIVPFPFFPDARAWSEFGWIYLEQVHCLHSYVEEKFEHVVRNLTVSIMVVPMTKCIPSCNPKILHIGLENKFSLSNQATWQFQFWIKYLTSRKNTTHAYDRDTQSIVGTWCNTWL